MEKIVMLFGLALLGEGLIKQFWPRQWVKWLAENPMAYMPEVVAKAGREYQSLSPSALRLIGLTEFVSGAAVLAILGSRGLGCCQRTES